MIRIAGHTGNPFAVAFDQYAATDTAIAASGLGLFHPVFVATGMPNTKTFKFRRLTNNQAELSKSMPVPGASGHFFALSRCAFLKWSVDFSASDLKSSPNRLPTEFARAVLNITKKQKILFDSMSKTWPR
jgi:hypothetical protein